MTKRTHREHLVASSNDVIEKACQLKEAKQAKLDIDREVADLQVRKRTLEQSLQTALVEQERNRNEENYLAAELEHACKEWLGDNEGSW